MKGYIILILAVILNCSYYVLGSGLPVVHFDWYNLNTNEILITDISGLPAEVSPGRLMPSHVENPLEVSESTFFDTISIPSRFIIKWRDNGTNGFHGDFELPGSIIPGVEQSAELKRDELGLPSKLEKGRIRFTYLGNGNWRIKYFNE
jgi:hypothetical protein